ncbi:MAG: MGMT family protein, partial [Oscillospiraceae bacterium]
MDNFAVYKTKIGYFKIGYCGNYIISLGITENKDNNFGNPSKLTDKLAVQLDEYFNGKRKKFDVPIFPQGSSFQKKVWEQLRLIDYGDTASYKDIAIRIGNPKACR